MESFSVKLPTGQQSSKPDFANYNQTPANQTWGGPIKYCIEPVIK